MRVIFLNHFFYPDHSATAQILSELAFALAERGNRPVIVTSRHIYDNSEACLPDFAKVNGVEVHRVYSSSFGRNSMLGRLVDYLTFFVFAALKLLAIARSGDIVVAKTDPPLLSVVVMLIAWLRGAIMINWLQDIFPEVAMELGGKKSKAFTPILSLLQKLRNISLHTARANVVLGEIMAERLRKQGLEDDRITIIPNWSDGDMIRPITHADNNLRKNWGLENSFVVGYSGNLGRAHDLNIILKAASALDNTAGNIVFLFIGGGAQRARLEREVNKLGLKNVMFRPYQPREMLAASLSAIDLHIASLKAGLEGLIVPSKFYGIAAAGRPTLFIGDRNGEIPRLLAREECGMTVPPHDTGEFAAQILRLAADRALCAQMGQRARKLFEQRFDKKHAVCRWERMLADIAASASSANPAYPAVAESHGNGMPEHYA
jgi:glycosyltransferase involved in cell wall biosynthesis